MNSEHRIDLNNRQCTPALNDDNYLDLRENTSECENSGSLANTMKHKRWKNLKKNI